MASHLLRAWGAGSAKGQGAEEGGQGHGAMRDPPPTALPAWLSLAVTSCKGQSSVTLECPQPVAQRGTWGQPHSRGHMDSQGEDLVPQQLRDPHLLPRLLGLAGQPVAGHLHVAVHPWWAALGLGLHRHDWAGTGTGSGSHETPCPLPLSPTPSLRARGATTHSRLLGEGQWGAMLLVAAMAGTKP